MLSQRPPPFATPQLPPIFPPYLTAIYLPGLTVDSDLTDNSHLKGIRGRRHLKLSFKWRLPLIPFKCESSLFSFDPYQSCLKPFC